MISHLNMLRPNINLVLAAGHGLHLLIELEPVKPKRKELAQY